MGSEGYLADDPEEEEMFHTSQTNRSEGCKIKEVTWGEGFSGCETVFSFKNVRGRQFWAGWTYWGLATGGLISRISPGSRRSSFANLPISFSLVVLQNISVTSSVLSYKLWLRVWDQNLVYLVHHLVYLVHHLVYLVHNLVYLAY